MIEVSGLCVSYGPIVAVRDVSFRIDPGEVLTIVGPNGAGKSSTMLAVAGGLGRATGVRARVSGSVRVDGTEVMSRSPDAIVRSGVALVPEGRRVFDTLTVEENLVVAAAVRKDRKAATHDRDLLLDRFPALRQSLHRPAGLLSGGQQQQLALSRALLSKPRVLLLDEPSLGLAPLVVDELFAIFGDLRAEGLALVLVEQSALRAIALADRAMLMHEGTLSEIDAGADGQRLLAAYFGIKDERLEAP